MRFVKEDELIKRMRKKNKKGLSYFSSILPGDFEQGAEFFNGSTAEANSGDTALGEEYIDRDYLLWILKKYSRHDYNFDKLSDGALKAIYDKDAEELNALRLADDMKADRVEHDKEMEIWRKKQAEKKQLEKYGQQISMWDKGILKDN